MDLAALHLLNGISFGSLLFLLSSSFSLILGVMGILNLSHGALYMIGAYVGWSLAVQYGLNFGLAILAGGAAAGLIGLIIERGFLRRLYMQLNEQVLLTYGFVHILTNLSLWLWGPVPRPPFRTPILSGSFSITDWSYPVARIAIIFIGLALAAGLWWLQDKTRAGAIVRAGMDDKQMAMGLGINLEMVSIVIFFLCSFIAGFAGVIGTQLLGANLALGMHILLLSLIVVVVGGIGSVQGSLLGAMLIGLIDNFGKALFPEFAMFTMYLVMIIVLAVRPRGLLGRRA